MPQNKAGTMSDENQENGTRNGQEVPEIELIIKVSARNVVQTWEEVEVKFSRLLDIMRLKVYFFFISVFFVYFSD